VLVLDFENVDGYLDRIGFFVPKDYRTEPGVSTPGGIKKGPALLVRRSSGNKGRRRKGGGREAFSALDAERDPQRISAAPSAPPTRYGGAISGRRF
jgi:hypothetical protein